MITPKKVPMSSHPENLINDLDGTGGGGNCGRWKNDDPLPANLR